jgi:sister-chromatid-cohesion protein PDS5
MQDEIFEVRQGFVIKLIKYLSTQTLPPKFASVLFLTAHDPEVELRDTVTVALKRLLDKSKAQNNPVQLLESTTPRLIYLLAHHPDFSRDGEDLQQFQRYLEFFLEIIATPDNISYIFECVSRLKNVYDLNSPEKSDCIYALSDLMQYTIKHFKLTAHWLIQPYTGSVALPSDMYRHLTNPQKMATIANHNFLPQEFFPTDQTRAMAPPVNSNMFSGDGNVPKSPRSPRSPRSPKSPRSPRSPRSPKSPKSPRSSSKRSLPQDAEPRS